MTWVLQGEWKWEKEKDEKKKEKYKDGEEKKNKKRKKTKTKTKKKEKIKTKKENENENKNKPSAIKIFLPAVCGNSNFDNNLWSSPAISRILPRYKWVLVKVGRGGLGVGEICHRILMSQ